MENQIKNHHTRCNMSVSPRSDENYRANYSRSGTSCMIHYHKALSYHQLMPTSCHFWDCKALLGSSITRIRRATASFPDLYVLSVVSVPPRLITKKHQDRTENLQNHTTPVVYIQRTNFFTCYSAVCKKQVQLDFLTEIIYTELETNTRKLERTDVITNDLIYIYNKQM